MADLVAVDLRGASLQTRRLCAVALASYACGHDAGRAVGDAVFESVTERRQSQSDERRRRGSHEVPYSACGDLAHWTLYRMGVRGSWVNRDEADGWRVGLNVARLQQAPTWRWVSSATRGMAPRGTLDHVGPGDVVMVGTTLQDSLAIHVAIVESLSLDGASITYDYGQADHRGACGFRRRSPSRVEGGDLWLGRRRVLGYLSLEGLPIGAAGEVPSDYLTGEVPDDLRVLT